MPNNTSDTVTIHNAVKDILEQRLWTKAKLKSTKRQVWIEPPRKDISPKKGYVFALRPFTEQEGQSSKHRAEMLYVKRANLIFD